MWTYKQRTGLLLDSTGKTIAAGYSGANKGINNPEMQEIHNIGPLPCGLYTIEHPIDTKTHGPYVMWLEPYKDNIMFGRSYFGIHGDSIINPGTASEGCIILLRKTREDIWNSNDHILKVIAD